MPDQESSVLHVSDTALWVAHYRAVESERADALFRDPYARLLAGERGKRIAEGMKSISMYTEWTLVIRTVLIDEYIRSAIAGGVDAVLNLGAGLDTRPYRMELPASLLWIEVDHSAIIDHKEALLGGEKPRCRLERVRLDLSDRPARQAFLSGVSQRGSRILVLTEGVLPYLTEDQVSELAEDLHERESFRFWLAEYISKETYRYINNPARMKGLANAPFRFFPDDWLGFFGRRGWAVREIRYLGEESLKLKRKIPAPRWAYVLMAFAGKKVRKGFRRATGFVLFDREALR